MNQALPFVCILNPILIHHHGSKLTPHASEMDFWDIYKWKPMHHAW
jgi:hypothetical protein